MDDLDRLQGRYPEHFMLISQLEVFQEGEVKKGGTWRTLGDLVIPDVMNDVFLPQGRYSEKFVPISLLEVCQEGGVQEGSFLTS